MTQKIVFVNLANFEFKSFYLLVIREICNQIVSGYLGYQKTICFLACNYYWLKMKNIVHCYIQNCHTYKWAKALRDQDNDVLKPLPLPSRLWTNNTPDFTIGLLLSNGYNSVLMIINQLTNKKMMIYSLFLVYHIYEMIRSFYQLYIRCVLFSIIVYVVIARRQKTIYFSYFVPRFLFSLFTFLNII